MHETTPPTSQSSDTAADIPRTIRTLGAIVSVVEVILGSLAIFLGLRYGGRRSVAVILVMAVLLLAYIALRFWRRYEERPDREGSIRRERPPRPES